MKRPLIPLTLFFCFSVFIVSYSQTTVIGQKMQKEKTAFQTSVPWDPGIDVRSDIAIVYGTGDRPGMTFGQRVETWREHGYTTQFMTGIAWGGYKDYFTGEWDGKNHLGEGQVDIKGDTIWHGKMVPYIVPSASFINYMKEKHIKRVIDAGIDAIFLEEPEFWAHAGYSRAFKDEWQKYYNSPWRPQDESPENTYLSSKLKYHLYYNALNEVFTYAKEYGKSKGMNVRCYVPTHSLINYSSWRIVSPEASLASLPCVDGYIAQVWTGTSREPVFFNGVLKERVFENAFLEYGSMESMTEPTGRKMFFLTDPVEDMARDWGDFKRNYEATFTAELLYPKIADYEVMPWPERIYKGTYKKPDSKEEETIPRYYSTQMQVMVNSLNMMPLSENKINGASGVSVLMSNSMMFQSFPVHKGYEDPGLSDFYGQTLPLLKRGVPVKIVHIENVSYPETWKDTKLLIMSYSDMKPLDPEAHKYIAQWVKDGGKLIYCGRDNDPFQTVSEWWNSGENHYNAPSGHLFEQLGMDRVPEEGEYKCGKGTVIVIRQDPKEFVLNAGGDKNFIAVVRRLYEQNSNVKLLFKNYFYLERGPFDLAAVMNESVGDKPLTIKGSLIDLFDPELPVIKEKVVNPGQQSFLYDISRVPDPGKPQVLAGASRVYNEIRQGRRYSFTVRSPRNTTNAMRILLPSAPTKTEITDAGGMVIKDVKINWDKASRTCFISFENNPEGVNVSMSFSDSGR